MNQQELMNTLEVILEDAKTAVLSTTAVDGKPHSRWMTPAILKWRPGVIFSFSRLASQKIIDIKAHHDVEWMFQTKNLSDIVHVKGPTGILTHPSLKAEILEVLGPRLAFFWNVDPNDTDIVILETIIKEAIYYKPTKHQREVVMFT